jgi:hypothetical protein
MNKKKKHGSIKIIVLQKRLQLLKREDLKHDQKNIEIRKEFSSKNT